MKQIKYSKSLYSLRKVPTQARSNATVETILLAAIRVLLSVGYDKASTNKIAEKAGVSVGSLYEYFPGKEAIFADVRRKEDKRLFELVMAKEVPESIKSLLKLHIATYLEFVRSNLALHTALINDVPQFAVQDTELAYYSKYVPWSSEFLEAHRNELRHPNNIPVMTDFVTRVVRATIDNYVLHAPDSLNDTLIEELLLDLVERFLLP